MTHEPSVTVPQPPGDDPRRQADAACVSVIIPTYRSASVVGDAIESVLAQTQPPDEIVVVDDGSPDDTRDVCARYGDRVRYLRQENAGASAARNTGVAAARGNWLAFLDADDVWEPDKLRLQWAAIAENPAADFCLTPTLVWSQRDAAYRLYRWSGPLDPDVMRAELLVRNIFTGLCSSLLIRREALEAVGGFDAGRAAEDRRLALALLERYRGVLLEHPLVRQRPGPAHWTDPERHRREMLRLIEDHADLYRRLDPSGLLRRRALGKVHDRTGMHYLENGDLRRAARELLRAAVTWPIMPNPWRVLANAWLGRLGPGAANELRASARAAAREPRAAGFSPRGRTETRLVTNRAR